MIKTRVKSIDRGKRPIGGEHPKGEKNSEGKQQCSSVGGDLGPTRE